jgi:hypothetical protein
MILEQLIIEFNTPFRQSYAAKSSSWYVFERLSFSLAHLKVMDSGKFGKIFQAELIEDEKTTAADCSYQPSYAVAGADSRHQTESAEYGFFDPLFDIQFHFLRDDFNLQRLRWNLDTQATSRILMSILLE